LERFNDIRYDLSAALHIPLQYIDDYTEDDLMGMHDFLLNSMAKSKGTVIQRKPSEQEKKIHENLQKIYKR